MHVVHICTYTSKRSCAHVYICRTTSIAPKTIKIECESTHERETLHAIKCRRNHILSDHVATGNVVLAVGKVSHDLWTVGHHTPWCGNCLRRAHAQLYITAKCMNNTKSRRVNVVQSTNVDATNTTSTKVCIKPTSKYCTLLQLIQ